MKIGELAERLNTTPRTIRLYEELGVIAPERTPGGTRLYREKDAKRLKIALRLAHLGRELGDIERLARTRERCVSGAQAAAGAVTLLVELRGWIDKNLDELSALKIDLQKADALIRQCFECPNKPNRKDCPACPIDRQVDSTDLARLIWDPDCP
ncbi:MerR family transcriptional regulator [Methylocystis sp. MJC1]|jgi:DNA-binding transcriptional MerR regulator|nr:MerR family transcriptional regulator [Methylocystis sp. MJC1]MBU6525853.1 MerR family transcriptional regulator [Methylocystis sp. MJC1]UZX12320.1 MerR family transcriptional regulator [Methylocystis sp. MJC1]